MSFPNESRVSAVWQHVATTETVLSIQFIVMHLVSYRHLFLDRRIEAGK